MLNVVKMKEIYCFAILIIPNHALSEDFEITARKARGMSVTQGGLEVSRMKRESNSSHNQIAPLKLDTTHVGTFAPLSTTPASAVTLPMELGTPSTSAVCPLEMEAIVAMVDMMIMGMLSTLSAPLAKPAQEAVQTLAMVIVTSAVVTWMMSIKRTVTTPSSTNVVMCV